MTGRDSSSSLISYELKYPVRQHQSFQDHVIVRSNACGKSSFTVPDEAITLSQNAHLQYQESEKWVASSREVSPYAVDVPAHEAKDRMELGLAPTSLIYNLDGDELSNTAGSYPGIHTPTAYVSLGHSLFASHLEDGKNMCAVNYLHAGAEKFWCVIAPKDQEKYENLIRNLCHKSEDGCSQFVRHESIFTYSNLLEEHQISFTLGRQTPHELIFIFEGAYHQGYNNGPNLAEAVNYLPSPLEIKDYQPCYRGCGHNHELCLPIPLDGLRPAVDKPSSKRPRRSTHHDSSLSKRTRLGLRDPKPSMLTSPGKSATLLGPSILRERGHCTGRHQEFWKWGHVLRNIVWRVVSRTAKRHDRVGPHGARGTLIRTAKEFHSNHSVHSLSRCWGHWGHLGP